MFVVESNKVKQLLKIFLFCLRTVAFFASSRAEKRFVDTVDKHTKRNDSPEASVSQWLGRV